MDLDVDVVVGRRADLDGRRRFDESIEILRLVAQSATPAVVVSAYRAAEAVALTRRESLLPGFAHAVQAARSSSFEVAIRPTGGRAAVMGRHCMVLEMFLPTVGGRPDLESVFEFGSTRLVHMLRELMVDARVGEVPGEFCPGPHSINVGGMRKIVGTAQRGIRGARMFSALVMMGVDARMRDVLSAVNACLALPWRPETLGSLEAELPGIPVQDVQQALADRWAAGARPTTLAELRRATSTPFPAFPETRPMLLAAEPTMTASAH